jgi:hypothetical protein
VGLVTLVLGLPVAPVRGVIAVAEVIQERVNQELYAPSSAREDLEAAEEARAAGEISPEEEAEVQQEVLDRMTEPAKPDVEER